MVKSALEAEARWGHFDLRLHDISRRRFSSNTQLKEPLVKYMWFPSVFDHDDRGRSSVSEKGHGLIRDYRKCDPDSMTRLCESS